MTSRQRWSIVLGTIAAIVAGGLAVAQPPESNQAQPPAPGAEAGPPGVPVIAPPPEPPAANATVRAKPSAAAVNALAGAEVPAAPPPPPPKPLRSPAAILQALDKVTAETMRFAAPVGERVRYKNLVFTVKACETAGLGEASPAAAAYVVVESAPLAVQGGLAAPAPKEVFRGWMYANDPALHPFQHPTYDAWLIACMAAAPKT